MLPAEQRRGLCARGVLQLHPSQGTDSGAGSRAGAGDKEMVKSAGEGSAECQSHAESRTYKEEVLILVGVVQKAGCLAEDFYEIAKHRGGVWREISHHKFLPKAEKNTHGYSITVLRHVFPNEKKSTWRSILITFFFPHVK